MQKQKVGRNDPCPCGSGRKFKKCCIGLSDRDAIRAFIREEERKRQQRRSEVESYLDLVPSVVSQGHRFRALFSTVYPRPPSETFHEFLVAVVQWTLGEDWWKHQIKMDSTDRHAVVRWKYEYSNFSSLHFESAEIADDSVTRISDATGPVWALLSFGYDLFCLQARDRLPGFLIDKLRKDDQFQGARYEIAAAAIMIRAGFDIEYLEDEVRDEKHCEFIATHRATGAQFGVEAKSRVRAGAVNERGEPAEFLESSRESRALERLVRKAQRQKPDGLPFLIFLDVNVPATPGIETDSKPWVKNVERLVGKLGKPSDENCDPFNAIVVTNFAFHFGSPDERAPNPEWGVVFSTKPRTNIDRRVLNPVVEILGRYERIPDEV